MIKAGSTSISKLYVGSDEITKAYVGTDVVYDSAPIILPYDAQVEYIETSGTQYIDLGISGNASFSVIAQATASASATKALVCSSSNAASTSWFGLNNNNKWGVGASSKQYAKLTGTTKVSVNISFVSTDGSNTASGNVNGANISKSDTYTHGNWRLFATTNATNAFIGRVFAFRAVQDDAVVLDMIPVRVGQVGYLYDKISGQLYGNDGTGSFILGNDISSNLYDSEIEYLETTGVIYVSTGYAPSAITPIIETYVYTPRVYSAHYVIGADGTTNQFFSIGLLANYRIEFRVGKNFSVTSNVNWHTLKLDGSNGEYYLDGTKQGTSSYRTYSSTSPILLFTSYSATNEVRTILPNFRISSFKLWNGATLLRDLKPVRVGGIGYFYDSVSRKLLPNIGTGYFICGNDITT